MVPLAFSKVEYHPVDNLNVSRPLREQKTRVFVNGGRKMERSEGGDRRLKIDMPNFCFCSNGGMFTAHGARIQWTRTWNFGQRSVGGCGTNSPNRNYSSWVSWDTSRRATRARSCCWGKRNWCNPTSKCTMTARPVGKSGTGTTEAEHHRCLRTVHACDFAKLRAVVETSSDTAVTLPGVAGHVLRRHTQRCRSCIPADVHRHLHTGGARQPLHAKARH